MRTPALASCRGRGPFATSAARTTPSAPGAARARFASLVWPAHVLPTLDARHNRLDGERARLWRACLHANCARATSSGSCPPAPSSHARNRATGVAADTSSSTRLLAAQQGGWQGARQQQRQDEAHAARTAGQAVPRAPGPLLPTVPASGPERTGQNARACRTLSFTENRRTPLRMREPLPAVVATAPSTAPPTCMPSTRPTPSRLASRRSRTPASLQLRRVRPRMSRSPWRSTATRTTTSCS